MTVQQMIDFLVVRISDPIPKYIMIKEIYKKDPSSPEYVNAYGDAIKSKWYRELAGEQWEDGSWGRFHSQNSKAQVRQKFVTTESALRRARELSLSNGLKRLNCSAVFRFSPIL